MRQILFGIPLPWIDWTVTLKGYGAMLCLGFLAAMWTATRRALRHHQPPDLIYNAAIVAFFGGVFGARLFHIVQYRQHFSGIWDFVAIWEGGLTYYGGLIVAAAAVIAYLKLSRQPVLFWADIIAPSLALGLAFGRLGCFLNGCCYGDAADWPWAFRWPVGSIPWQHHAAAHLAAGHLPPPETASGGLGAAMGAMAATWQMPHIHPAQLYSALNALLLFFVLNKMFQWKRRHGQVLLTFLLLYGVSRFLLETLRADEARTYLFGLPTLLRALGFQKAALPGLTISQNLAILMAAGSAAGLVLLARSARPELRAEYVPARAIAPQRAQPTARARKRKGKRP